MDLWHATLLGAVGGLLVEVIGMWSYLAAWQADRREYREKDKHPLPKLTDHYLDLQADSLVAATRLGLGAVAGVIFHSQVTGDLAAIMVGASAPAILLQLGHSKAISSTLGGISELTSSPESDGAVPGEQVS